MGDLVETHIRPAIKDRKAIIMANIENKVKELKDYVQRFLLVTELKKNRMNDDADLIEDDRNVDDADLFSEVSTVRDGATTAKTRSTLQTRQTQRSKSSKNRRKNERKIYSTREGSLYEDIGLMAVIHELILGLPAIRKEVGELMRGLIEVDMNEKLEWLQIEVETLLDEADKCIKLVWNERMCPTDPAKDKFGPEATVEDIIKGGVQKSEYSPPIHLLPPNLRYPPSIKKDDNWKLQIL